MDNNDLIVFTNPIISNGKITFHGAGKYNEESITWNKQQALLAYIELHKFLFK